MPKKILAIALLGSLALHLNPVAAEETSTLGKSARGAAAGAAIGAIAGDAGKGAAIGAAAGALKKRTQ